MKKVINEKYRSITNIDLINGVTPQQLIDQAWYLIRTIKGINQLDEIEQEDVVHIAVASVWQKMNEGLVPKYNYDYFKGYFFIAIRNFAYTALRKKNAIKEVEYNEEYVVIDEGYELSYDESPEGKMKMKIVENIISTYKEEYQVMIKDYLAGKKQIEITTKYAKSKSYFLLILYRIKDEIARIKFEIKSKKIKEIAKKLPAVLPLPKPPKTKKKQNLIMLENLIKNPTTQEEKSKNIQMRNRKMVIKNCKTTQQKISKLQGYGYSQTEIEFILQNINQ